MAITWRQIWLFIRLSRPFFLLGGIILYGLGAAIVDYLGRPLDLSTYIIGQLIVTFIQLMTHYLNEYSDAKSDRENPNRTFFTGGSGVLGEDGLPRRTALYAAAFCLAITATCVILLIANTRVSILSWIVLILAFLGSFFYSLPPLNLARSGYGEFTTSIIVAGLVPTFAYTLQTGEVHRLLIMSTTPLVALHLAMMIVIELPDYATDLKYNKQNLVIRIGWSSAMRLHNVSILFAIGSFIVAYFLGMPPRVFFGTLIALPLAVAQVWQMYRIRQGYPPNWRVLTANAVVLFGLTAYLEVVGYILS
ncbi:MAG: hypothetical protein GTO18_01010 [Anaerolineales bacterium]|nr:hypothetical protein [Anaerolineales bacterium]